MRHRVASKHFNRDTNHRKMLFRNLVRSLIEHGEIVTTVAKAKETRRVADRLIHTALVDSVATRRQLHTFFGQRDVVNTLVEKIAPAMKKRVSGFTTLVWLGKRRGDNVELVKLSLVEQRLERHTLKSKAERPKRTKKVGKKKSSKKLAAKRASQAKRLSVVQKLAQKETAKPRLSMPVAQRVQRTTAKGK